MKSGIFSRIFMLYALVLLLTLLFAEVYLTSAVRESYTDNLKQNLSIQINLISKSITFDEPLIWTDYAGN